MKKKQWWSIPFSQLLSQLIILRSENVSFWFPEHSLLVTQESFLRMFPFLFGFQKITKWEH